MKEHTRCNKLETILTICANLGENLSKQHLSFPCPLKWWNLCIFYKNCADKNVLLKDEFINCIVVYWCSKIWRKRRQGFNCCPYIPLSAWSWLLPFWNFSLHGLLDKPTFCCWNLRWAECWCIRGPSDWCTPRSLEIKEAEREKAKNTVKSVEEGSAKHKKTPTHRHRPWTFHWWVPGPVGTSESRPDHQQVSVGQKTCINRRFSIFKWCVNFTGQGIAACDHCDHCVSTSREAHVFPPFSSALSHVGKMGVQKFVRSARDGLRNKAELIFAAVLAVNAVMQEKLPAPSYHQWDPDCPSLWRGSRYPRGRLRASAAAPRHCRASVAVSSRLGPWSPWTGRPRLQALQNKKTDCICKTWCKNEPRAAKQRLWGMLVSL